MKRFFSSLILALIFATPLAASASIIGKPANNLGLVGYWPMNEGSGASVGDASGNKNNGTFGVTPTWTQGKFGQAASFDGASQYVAVGNASTLQITGQVTMSAWVKFTSFPTSGGPCGGNYCAAIIEKGYDGSNEGYVLRYSQSGTDPVLQAGSYNGVQHFVTSPALTFPVNTWHMVTGIYDGSNWILYLDGSSTVSVADATGALTTTAPTSIGAGWFTDHYERFFPGVIDDARIYNRALSPTEVMALYQSGSIHYGASSAALQNGTTLANGLVGLWTMDGADMVSNVTDRSGSGNTGYLSGASTSSMQSIGKLGQAVTFTGTQTSPNIHIPYSSSLGITASTTLSAWVKSSSTTAQQVILSRWGGTNAYALQMDGNNSRCFLAGQNSLTAVALSDGVWHLLTCTYDGITERIYIDGAQNSSQAASGPIHDNFEELGIGYEGDGFGGMPFVGSIDDVRIYNRVLSAAEVKQLYQLGQVTRAKSSATLTNGSSLASNLVGLWTFDGPDVVSNVADRSGQGNTGYMINMATSAVKTIGKLGQALNFRSDQYVTVSDASSLKPSQISVAAWVNPSSLPDFATIAMKTTGDNWNDGWGLNHTDGADNKVYFWINTWNINFAFTTVPLNDWSFVVGTYDGANIDIYLNGALANQTAYSTALNNSGAPLYIGRGGGSGPYPWTGKLDDVRVYNKALSAAEVKQLYLMGK